MSPPSLTVRPIMPDVDGWHESTWQHQHDTKSLRRQALTTTSVQTGKKKGCSTGTRTRLTPPKYCYFCYSTLHSEQYTHFSSFDYFYWGHRYGFFVKQGFGGWGLKFVNIILAKKNRKIRRASFITPSQRVYPNVKYWEKINTGIVKYQEKSPCFAAASCVRTQRHFTARQNVGSRAERSRGQDF